MRSRFPAKSRKILPILSLFKSGVSGIYGNKLRRVILYGSYARGSAGSHSDIDLMIVLSEMNSAFEEIEKLNEIKFRIALENDVFISTNPVTEEAFEKAELPIFKNVQKDGIAI
jgi:predicted nucleotidyltransferase